MKETVGRSGMTKHNSEIITAIWNSLFLSANAGKKAGNKIKKQFSDVSTSVGGGGDSITVQYEDALLTFRREWV